MPRLQVTIDIQMRGLNKLPSDNVPFWINFVTYSMSGSSDIVKSVDI